MNNPPPKSLVGGRFSRAAVAYERYARHQAVIAGRLAGFLPEGRDRARILELGCGTGLLTGHLVDHFPGAELLGLDLAQAMVETCRSRWHMLPNVAFMVADAEQYSSAERYDIVAASCVVQWFERPHLLGDYLAGMLSSAGVALLAIPLRGTLRELSGCVEEVTGRPMPGLALGDAESYLALFDNDVWVRARAEEFDVVQWYASPGDVLRGVREIGVRCSGYNGNDILGAGELRAVTRRYQEKFAREDGCVSSTYRVLLCAAERR